MIRWRQGTVLGTLREWPGALELDVEVDRQRVVALAYPLLVGRPEPGDAVLLNTTAIALGLGTGGYALVVAVPGRLPLDPAGPGHLMKARYTPLQAAVLGVEEPESPHHEAIRAADSLGGLPVVIADLHSALPAIVAGVLADRPGTRVSYVMTDGGALPLWFSRTVATLRDRLCGTVTVGQTLGGDLEAVTLHTGLLAARHVQRADVAVVTQGPGNLGTATPWGFSGVAAGEAVNAVSALGGRPVATLRLSGDDPRDRHQGVSHHSLTAYGRVALAAADVVVPAGLPAALAARVASDVVPLRNRHAIVEVDTTGLYDALRGLPVQLSSMGRGLAQDPSYFLACAAAGRHAAGLIS
ncbi:MAG: DUF3866 domain-containing protein [Pseudonocardiales bacterium]|nr:MAG: DUF3866 domain-containing protein [Pseudonocardiales bacterium]